MKTHNYTEAEIKGILPDGTIVLKEGVKKSPKYWYLDEYDNGHINEPLRLRNRYYEAMYYLYGEGDPEGWIV